MEMYSIYYWYTNAAFQLLSSLRIPNSILFDSSLYEKFQNVEPLVEFGEKEKKKHLKMSKNF